MLVLEDADDDESYAHYCACAPEDTIASLGATHEQKFLLEMK